jgi:hypothetical protein
MGKITKNGINLPTTARKVTPEEEAEDDDDN